MSARVAQTPPASYQPKGSTDCMVYCDECFLEWAWGAAYDLCRELADKHNAEVHSG